MRLVGVALALSLLAGGVAAQVDVSPPSVTTNIYLHPLGIQDFPMNTQVPRLGPWNRESFGPATVTLTCLHATTGTFTGGVTSQTFTTYFGYSTLSFINYDRTASNGQPLVHPTRGLAYDAVISGSPVLHWSMTPAELTETRPGAVANVVVEATLRAPDVVSPDDVGYDSGIVLLSGQTEPVSFLGTTMTGPGSSQVSITETAGQTVYTFQVPLAVENAVIPQASGFTLRVDVRMEVPTCTPGTAIMPSVLEPYAGPDHWSYLALDHGEPLRQEPLQVWAGQGNVTLRANTTSVWGAYDVDVPNATLTITGPATTAARLHETIWRTVEHNHLAEPVAQTWVVDTQDLPDGVYTAIYRVGNRQATATAQAVVTFTVTDGQLQEGPPRQASWPATLPVAALGLALLGRRWP